MRKSMLLALSILILGISPLSTSARWDGDGSDIDCDAFDCIESQMNLIELMRWRAAIAADFEEWGGAAEIDRLKNRVEQVEEERESAETEEEIAWLTERIDAMNERIADMEYMQRRISELTVEISNVLELMNSCC